MKRRFLIVFLVMLLGASASGSSYRVSTRSLLKQMSSFSRLARAFPEGTRLVQFSSYDRKSEKGKDKVLAWYANRDFGNYLRAEKTERGFEFVMAEAEGPGALVRMWSANPGNKIWRVYIDGEDEPSIESRGDDLLGGKVEPWSEVFADKRNMGGNFIFPIPFSESVKVTVSRSFFTKKEAPPMMYYHVDLRLYPEDIKVKSFSRSALSGLEEEMERTAAILSEPADNLTYRGRTDEAMIELAPGASGELFTFSGERALSRLTLEVKSKALPEVLGKTLLTMSWDGDPAAVSVPLGDFFGASPGAPELHSLPSSIVPVENGARLVSRWVMPFREDAKLWLENQSGERLKLRAEAVTRPWEWGPDSLYFHACFREKNDLPTRPWSDMTMLSAEGRGNFAGLVMNVRNPMELFWWGEGDEKIWVDDDKFPSIFGTGTEDYFGYAWCVQYFKFTHAYHGIPVPTEEWLVVPQALPVPFLWEAISRATAKEAIVSQYRWHFPDVIPFDKRIKFDMEIYHHRKTEIDVNATAFWYGSPGCTDDCEMPELSSREMWGNGAAE
ncbi:MAG: glycoside hydrolase family 172 protein [bacterium]